jgi:hypothetical protein
MAWTVRASNAGRGKKFYFLQKSRQVMGPTQHHIQWVPVVREPERDADHSPASSADGKNECSCIATPSYAFRTSKRATLLSFYLPHSKKQVK